MRLRVFIVFMAVALIRCASSAPTRADASRSVEPSERAVDAFPLVQGVAFKAVIIPFTNGFDLRWVPTSDDVVTAEQGLEACVRARFQDADHILREHVRQYSGFYIEQTRVLRARFFDLVVLPGVDWRHGSVDIDHHGSEFVELYYDAETRRCVQW